MVVYSVFSKLLVLLFCFFNKGMSLSFYFAVATTCRYVQLIGRVLDKQKEINSFGSEFLSFCMKIAGVHTYGSLRKSPAPAGPK